MNADRIIVVDDGSILEQGTHDKLIAAGGKYAELWSKQVSVAYLIRFLLKATADMSHLVDFHQAEDRLDTGW